MPRVAVLVTLLLAPMLVAQEDQRPRAPKKDERGLLAINKDFYDIAASTGGDFYFWAAGEFAVAGVQIPIPADAVVLSYGTIAAKTSFDIPIETGVKRMTVFAGIQRKDLALLIRPDGTVARDREEGVAIQLFQHMLIATITAPAAGKWRLELDGVGTYAFTAHVQPADDGPELTGFKIIEGTRCRVSLGGAIKEAEIAFVRADGSVISTAPIDEGRCTIPDVPYRVTVRGVDDHGNRFQRADPPLRAVSR